MGEEKKSRTKNELLESIEAVKQVEGRLKKSHKNDSSRTFAFFMAHTRIQAALEGNLKKNFLSEFKDVEDPRPLLLNQCDAVLEATAQGTTAGKAGYYLGILPVIAYGMAEVAEHFLDSPSMSQELLKGNPDLLIHWTGIYSFLLICHYVLAQIDSSSDLFLDPARLPWVPPIISGEIPTRIFQEQVEKMKSIINDPGMKEVLNSYQNS
jgi:hypothetical protein